VEVPICWGNHFSNFAKTWCRFIKRTFVCPFKIISSEATIREHKHKCRPQFTIDESSPMCFHISGAGQAHKEVHHPGVPSGPRCTRASKEELFARSSSTWYSTLQRRSLPCLSTPVRLASFVLHASSLRRFSWLIGTGANASFPVAGYMESNVANVVTIAAMKRNQRTPTSVCHRDMPAKICACAKLA